MTDKNLISIDLNDDIYFEDSLMIGRFIKIFKGIDFSSIGIDEKDVENFILSLGLSFCQKYYCEGCKYRNKDLKWHQENNTEISWYHDYEIWCMVFECNNMEKDKDKDEDYMVTAFDFDF